MRLSHNQAVTPIFKAQAGHPLVFCKQRADKQDTHSYSANNELRKMRCRSATDRAQLTGQTENYRCETDRVGLKGG